MQIMKASRRITSLHDPRYRKLIASLVKTRKRIGITQLEIADALELGQPDISKVERFERRLDILEFLGWLKVFSSKDKILPSKICTEIYEGFCRSK